MIWLSENGFWYQMLPIDYNRTSNVFVDVNVSAKNHNFKIPLILDKCNIMIIMTKINFMQEFSCAMNVDSCHQVHGSDASKTIDA